MDYSDYQRLTPEDIKQLKYNLRPGILFCLSFFILGILLYVFASTENPVHASLQITSFIIVSISLFLLWIFNHKIWKDLNYGVKIVKTEKISGKGNKVDFEPGSSVGTTLNNKKTEIYLPMKKYTTYYLIVDNVKHLVNRELWESVDEGDDIEIHLSKYSERILGFYKKEKAS